MSDNHLPGTAGSCLGFGIVMLVATVILLVVYEVGLIDKPAWELMSTVSLLFAFLGPWLAGGHFLENASV